MQRIVVYSGLLLFILAFIVWMYFLKDTYEILPIQTTLNEKPLPLKDSWYEYDDPEGEFKVSLPLLPQTADQNVVDPKTDETRRYAMYVAQTDEGTIYMISVITLPKEPEGDAKVSLLKQMMNDLVSAKSDNKLVTSKNVDYQGFPAIDFTVENDHSIMEAREFIRGKTLYLISAITRKDSKEKSHFQYFIDSFKLNKK